MKISQANKSTRNEIDKKIKDLYALFSKTENANEEIKQWIYTMMPKDSEEVNYFINPPTLCAICWWAITSS
jgi:hypothetical protein